MQLDDQSLSTCDQRDSGAEQLTLTSVKLLGDAMCDESMNATTTDDQFQLTLSNKKGRKPKMKDETTSYQLTSSASNRGRRKSALVKLMQKNKRKKRKKTSSGEEDDNEEDDSDDFELSNAFMTKAKKEEQAASYQSQEDTNQHTAAATTGDDDEATAKMLQANEKRRSTRTVKRQKYSDADYKLKEADLLMPANDNDQVEVPVQVANGNIVFASQDSLIVDKILGIRLFKRKTKRKKEKQQKQPKSEKKTVEIEVVIKTTSDLEPQIEVENNESKMDIDQSLLKETEPDPKLEENPAVIEEAPKQEIKPEEEDQEEDEEDELSEYEEDGGEIEVEEFFVKYKALSYLHCEWRTRDEIFISDKRIDQKIKRFRLKKQQSQVYEWDNPDLEANNNNNNNGYNNDFDELFNPDYLLIDRILDEYEVDDAQKPGQKLKYYLIKWKSSPYDEATWELEQDVKNSKKIERFHLINKLNPDFHLKYVSKPKPDRWDRMTASKTYKNGNTLREYQLEGINWLTFCWLNARNCILADEMGLGKTVQSITFLHELACYGVRGPFLVLVPLSTIGNWIREFETWTDFNVIVYHGSSASRQMLQDYEFYFKDSVHPVNKKPVVKFDALITTYEVLLSDVPLFCQFKWRNCVIDEAHRLKNKNCKLIEGLRYMDVEHKVLLTGTPLQNNVEELFSLLNFLEPLQFHSSVDFLVEFGDLKTDTQVQKLQAVLKPMMLRRLKEDVEKNLKPKEETIVEVELTNTQKKYYRAILEKNFQFLSRGATAANTPNLMNTMMELRKCCNHPYLTDGAEDQITEEFAETHKMVNNERLSLQAMIQASGKLVLVDKLLPKLKAGGHRVLIFSQMIRVLDILEDYLIQMRFTYERLDGRIRGEARQEAIDRYSKPDSDRFVFLLCTRAGGLGINLTAADTVIIYDSDWNPQNDLQAQARVHRIGQQKSVKIYRLITRNTYEREMFDRASLKLGLDKALLQSMRNEDKFNANAPNPTAPLSKKEIEDLLKKGAYGALMEDDMASDKFCEEDIDKILQQRSTIIQIEGGEKGSTFSKASFQTNETSDISIDDPEFWQKWAKKADIDIEEKLNPKDERIMYEPRRRTQTRRYGGPDDVLEESDYSSSDSDQNKEQNGAKDGSQIGKEGKDGKRRGKKAKRGRGNGEDAPFKGYDNEDLRDFNDDEDSNVWSREECYKVEKLLLIYGWSRWSKILKNLEFSSKRKGAQVQTEQDVENLSRTIIAYTLKNYQGDESIKQFIIDLIDPSKSNFTDLKNHHGLAAPVARGRKPREEAAPSKETTTIADLADLEWARHADELLADENYKKHLIKQANKILLRIRMLFYIKSEIIGDEYSAKLDQTNSDLCHESADLQIPDVSIDLPAEWWDRSCDVSMLIGVYKHGFEKYYQMRLDPMLCFLGLCGPPDAKDLLAEQQQQQQEENNEDNNEAIDVDDSSATNRGKEDPEWAKSATSSSSGCGKIKKFPTVSELNNRLRRMIASVQKYKKQEQMMSKRNAERQEKRLSKLASNQERAQARQAEKQSKWSRREEQNFYKAIASFGVDCIDKTSNVFAWDRFREIGQLDKKLDETLTDYYNSFFYMCKKVCHKLTEDDQVPLNEVPVEMISEERASRCLQRVELLNKIRNDVLKHESFDEWILERCMPSADLPDWYIPGKHDRELVKAAARYGITRTEFYYFNDADFSFKEYLAKYMKHIEDLMDQENSCLESDSRMLDPIQYYFQNQAKIQVTFKDLLNKENGTKEQDEALKQPEKEDVKEPEEEVIDKEEEKESEEAKEIVEDDAEENKEIVKQVVKEVVKQVEADVDVEKVAEEEEEKFENKSELIDTSQKELVIDEDDGKDHESPVKTFKVDSPSKQELEVEVEVEVEVEEAKTPLKEDNDVSMKIDDEKENIKEEKPNDLDEFVSKSEAKIESISETEKVEIKAENVENVENSENVENVDKDKPAESPPLIDEEEEKQNAMKEEKIEKIEKIEKTEKLEKPEPTSYFQNNSVPMIMWPKDRVIFNRLENIIQLFESNGEWPHQRALFLYQQHQQQLGALNLAPSSTSLSSSSTTNTQIPTNSLSISNLVQSSSSSSSSSNNLYSHHQHLLAEQRKLMLSPLNADNCSVDDEDDNLSTHDNDPDYFTKATLNNNNNNNTQNEPSAKYQKPKRGRPPKLDLPQLASSMGISASAATATPADPAHKIRNLLHTNSSSKFKNLDELDSIDENSMFVSKHADSNKSGFLEPGEIFRPKSSRSKTQQADSENSDASSSSSSKPGSSKRGRKSASSKEQQLTQGNGMGGQPAMNPADLAALAALFLAPGQDPDERITVINMEDGTRLTGSKAPKRIDLPMWLMTHPNYLPDEQEIINMTLKNSSIAALQQQQQQQQNETQQLQLKHGQKRKSLKQAHPSTPHDYMAHSPQSVDQDEDLSPPRPPSSNSSITQPSPVRSKSLGKQQLNETPKSSPAHAESGLNTQIVLFNKTTQKKLNSQKIPPFKHLGSFLDKNEQVYIDPGSNEFIRSKYGKNIPEIIKSRMINLNKPSGKPMGRGGSSASPPPLPQPALSTTPKSNGQNKKQSNNNKQTSQQQQQQQQSQQQQLFNPFSPNSAAQLQGLSELLGATGGVDFNNPMASFMAAALASQAGPNATGAMPFGSSGAGFNPFLLPPFAPSGLAGSSAASSANMPFNPLLADLFKDFGNKLPPGLDMTSFDELTASLAALQQQSGLGQAQSSGASSPAIRPESAAKLKDNNKNGNGSGNNQLKRREKDQEHELSINKPKQTKQAQLSQQNQSNIKEKDSSRSSSHPKQSSSPAVLSSHNNKNSNSIESKLNSNNSSSKKTEASSSSSSSSTSSKSKQLNENQTRQSSKETKSQLNQLQQQQQQHQQMDFASIAAAMQQLDPTNPANVAALASMMEQEKFLQEMMNFSQFNSAGFPAGNPFYFGGSNSPFTTPQVPPPSLPSTSHKSTRGRTPSPSPNADRDHSISPALSVASNMSSQHQQPGQVPPPLDFNLFMNNLMSYQMGGVGSNAFTPAHLPPPPPPMMGGMPGDLSKLPVDLLAALTAAASQPGGLGGLDPTMFSALAQLNSLSNNVANEDLKEARPCKSGLGSGKSMKPGSSSGSSSSGKVSGKNQGSVSNNKQSSSVRTPSSQSQSQSPSLGQHPKKPRLGSSNDVDDSYQGLDLSIKKQSSKSKSSDGNGEDAKLGKSSSAFHSHLDE